MILCEHCGGREKMNKEFLDAIEANPIIAAVKDEQGLQNCLGREELTVIFILYGDIRSIGGIVIFVKISMQMGSFQQKHP